MIPREILKKIRQIELRTNRIVAKPLADSSLQPSAQFGWIPGTVKYRDNADELSFNAEIDAVTIKSHNFRFVNSPARKLKSIRILKNSKESGMNCRLESVTQSGLLPVVPQYGIFKFESGLEFKDYFAGHARRCARRSLSSARTFSQVTPNSGWRRSFSARASSFSANSGGISSANTSCIRCNTSNCSSKGRRRNCSRISVALMPAIYTLERPTQAGFSGWRGAHHTSLSP
jgi:hypothetical protein